MELPTARWQQVGQHRRRLLMLLLLVGQLVLLQLVGQLLEQCRRLPLMLMKVWRRLLLVLLKVLRCSCSCCCDYGSPSAQCLGLVLRAACDHLRRELRVAAFLFVLHPCWSHSASHTALLPVVLRKGSVLLHREEDTFFSEIPFVLPKRHRSVTPDARFSTARFFHCNNKRNTLVNLKQSETDPLQLQKRPLKRPVTELILKCPSARRIGAPAEHDAGERQRFV